MESGMCSMKNEVNILCKNVVDVVLGGMSFWAFGYGLVMGPGRKKDDGGEGGEPQRFTIQGIHI